MKKALRYLIRNATVLNAVLLAVVIALVVGIAVPIVRMRYAYSLPGVKAKPPVEDVSQLQAAAKLPSDYAIIGETNLFHPDRVIPVDKKAEVPRPEVVLYGTMIDTVSLAFIEDKKQPRSTPGRGNRQNVVKKGEVVSGYTVTEIFSDRIVLARGDDRITVMLSPPEKRKAADSSPSPGQQPAARPVQTPVRPQQTTPVTPVRPQQAAPQTQRGVQVPPLPVGETVRPPATPKPQPPSPRSVPE